MDVKSQALCPDRPRYARRSLLLRALRTSSVSGPLAPRSRVALTLCHTSRPRVLYASPFSQHPVGSRSSLSSLYQCPLSYFPLLETWSSARLPHRVTPLCSPLSSLNSSRERLKALVWFWLIDETLTTNLVYQSDYEISSTIPSGEANEDHDMMMAW